MQSQAAPSTRTTVRNARVMRFGRHRKLKPSVWVRIPREHQFEHARVAQLEEAADLDQLSDEFESLHAHQGDRTRNRKRLIFNQMMRGFESHISRPKTPGEC